MSVAFQFRALQRWPKKPTSTRQRARFDTKHSETMKLLEREVSHLGARSAVIEADCDEREVRRDGMLRADARLRGPGIIISFDGRRGPLQFACDRFTEWQDNLRAIALGLEALRMVDRYGITSSDEQYRGFAALPDKSKEGAFSSLEAACVWLGSNLGIPVPHAPQTDDERKAIRRVAMAAFHPDRNDGNDNRWRLWLDAAKVIGIEV